VRRCALTHVEPLTDFRKLSNPPAKRYLQASGADSDREDDDDDADAMEEADPLQQMAALREAADARQAQHDLIQDERDQAIANRPSGAC
jgi:hypothetical protein